jgi:hypothetical protein
VLQRRDDRDDRDDRDGHGWVHYMFSLSIMNYMYKVLVNLSIVPKELPLCRINFHE